MYLQVKSQALDVHMAYSKKKNQRANLYFRFSERSGWDFVLYDTMLREWITGLYVLWQTIFYSSDIQTFSFA
jgi:hypothetical protein